MLGTYLNNEINQVFKHLSYANEEISLNFMEQIKKIVINNNSSPLEVKDFL